MFQTIKKLGVTIVLLSYLGACATTEQHTEKLSSPSGADLPPQSSQAERALIRMQLGVSYLQQNQLTTALKELNQALSIDPYLADAYEVRGIVYMQLNDKKAAQSDFLKALGMQPNHADYKNNYGWFLCLHGEEARAMGLFDEVLADRTYAQPVKALNNAGLCSLRMKDDARAERYFLQSVRLDADNPTTNLNLARLAYKKHDWEHALFYINRLIKKQSFSAEIVWVAIKTNHQLNNQAAVYDLVQILKNRYPDSEEFALWQRGVFN